MKMTLQKAIRRSILLLTLLLGSSLAHAETQVSFSVFYNSLAPYGTWVDHPRYHRVWYPRGVPAGWRPYSHGHWAYTHQHGWMWESDWEWGWATFHYGRWAHDNYYGWIWIPGDVWGPGWVAWRSAPGYIGWAPLPPDVYWDDNYGLSRGIDDYYGIDIGFWIFVGETHFQYPHLHRHVYQPLHNRDIIRVTSNITNFTIVNRRVVNQCLPIRRVEQFTRQPVRIHHIHEVENANVLRQSHRDIDVIRIYRPPVRHITPQRVPPNRNYPQNRYPDAHRDDSRYRERDNEIRAIQSPLFNESPRRQQEQPIKVYPQTRQVEPSRHDDRRRDNVIEVPATEASSVRKEPRRQQEQPIKHYQTAPPPQSTRRENREQRDSREHDRHDRREYRQENREQRKDERQENKQIYKNEKLFKQ